MHGYMPSVAKIHTKLLEERVIMLRHHTCREIMACANVYNVWNVHDYSKLVLRLAPIIIMICFGNYRCSINIATIAY